MHDSIRPRNSARSNHATDETKAPAQPYDEGMGEHPRQTTTLQRQIGRVALLIVVLALIGNVVALAWLRPYSILSELGDVAEARERIHALYVGEVDDQALIDAALTGMADSLGDENTQYLSAQQLALFEEHFAGEFSGIGAEIDIHEGRLRIVAPLDDSPAWNSGVLPGDIVLEIDGEDTLGIDIYEAMRKLKGKAGTQVRIKVRHRDGSTQDLTITRQSIEVVSVRGYRRDPGNGYHYMIDPARKIAYVRLTQFGEKSYSELSKQLKELKAQGMAALIFDLRDNGGGLLDAAVDTSDLFIGGGKKIVSTRGRSEPLFEAYASNKTLLPDTPLVVLVNENSASASEIFAGAMIDNGRALVVGTRTFGKGSVQQLMGLGNGKSALKLTTAYWYLPSGRVIHRKPGATTWGVDPSPGGYVAMDDERVREMLMKRRDAAADDPYEKLEGPVTPAWIQETLLDDQLAAALEAAQQRLETGKWPRVGEDVEDVLAEPTEAQALSDRRKELLELIEEIDEQIESLEAGSDSGAEAEPSDAAGEPADAGASLKADLPEAVGTP